MSEHIVLKWPLPGPTFEETMLPGPVVAVAWQRGLPTIWIDHFVDSAKVLRRFMTVATGEVFIPNGALHVGSAVSDLLVFHVYELVKP